MTPDKTTKCLFIYVGANDDIFRFFVLLESILVYGKIFRDNNIKIIVGIHSASIYRNRIVSSHLWKDSMQLVEMDSLDFTSGVFGGIDRILSLHTNCVVIGDLKPMFYSQEVAMSNLGVVDNHAWFPECIQEFAEGGNTTQDMMHFFDIKKNTTILQHIYTTIDFIHEKLMPIIREIGEELEGNIFMGGHSEVCTNVFENKTKNICYLMLNESVSNVMEIGFNSGFSSLLMLIANPNIKLQCYDLGEHRYTVPCFMKIKEVFGDRIHLVLGDSMQTLKNDIGRYDVIHIDGGHSTVVAESDILQSYRVSMPGSILIMDDYNFGNLHQLWDNYVVRLGLRSLDIRLYSSPHHDIKVR